MQDSSRPRLPQPPPGSTRANNPPSRRLWQPSRPWPGCSGAPPGPTPPERHDGPPPASLAPVPVSAGRREDRPPSPPATVGPGCGCSPSEGTASPLPGQPGRDLLYCLLGASLDLFLIQSRQRVRDGDCPQLFCGQQPGSLGERVGKRFRDDGRDWYAASF